jgi:hypothetical protein
MYTTLAVGTNPPIWDSDSNAYAEGVVAVIVCGSAQTINITGVVNREYYTVINDQYARPIPNSPTVANAMQAISDQFSLPQSQFVDASPKGWFSSGSKSYKFATSVLSGAKTVMDYVSAGVGIAAPILERMALML